MSRTESPLGLRHRLLLAVLTPVYRLWMATVRRRWAIHPETEHAIVSGEPLVFALWHETLLSTLYSHRGVGLVVMISRHRDGEMITRLARRFGFEAERGSTTRGGVSALRGMVRAAQEGSPLAITPDGPRGPRRKVQPGAIEIARRSGRRLVVAVPIQRPVHRFGSWDRMALPWPFARGLVAYGEPLEFPPDEDRERATERLQAALDATMAEAEDHFDQRWRSGGRRSPHPRVARPPARDRTAGHPAAPPTTPDQADGDRGTEEDGPPATEPGARNAAG